MLFKTSLAATFAALTTAETIHGVVVFTRHGDRTAKFYPGYQMTNLGANQVYDVGQYYRQRYVAEDALSRIANIEPNRVDFRQVWASAPDQAILYQTATNFLQGLYPPLGEIDQDLAAETLVDGSTVTDPLNGYQFVFVHGEGETDPDTIWLKGDDACPAYSSASKSYSRSPEYQNVLNTTDNFYSQFETLLAPILGEENVTYKNAYDVFDLLNVASIHNESVAADVETADLDQLRYLANEWEWNHNFNATHADRSIGGMALAGAFLRRLNATTATQNKFQLMTGSYDTFLAFFGLTNLTAASDDFYGLPNYASSMAMELITELGTADNPATFPVMGARREELRVRFLFRNGSDPSSELTAYPLFGGSELTLPYGRFSDELSARAINSVEQWCNTCGSTEDFCVAANITSPNIEDTPSTPTGSRLSNTAAGGIGAGVTLAVVGLVCALVFLLFRRRKDASEARGYPFFRDEKRVSDSGSDYV